MLVVSSCLFSLMISLNCREVQLNNINADEEGQYSIWILCVAEMHPAECWNRDVEKRL